jgi:cytochrome b
MRAAMRTAETFRSDSGRDDAGWLLLLFISVAVAGFQLSDPFSFNWLSIRSPAVLICVLAATAAAYRRWRPKAEILAMLNGLQQVCLFCSLGAVLSYMLAAKGGAYWDARLQSWDEALGLDWMAYLRFWNDHPGFAAVARTAYQNLILQMIVLVVALSFAGRLRELRTAVLAAMLSGLVAITLSGLTPAVSNFAYLELDPSLYSNLSPSAAFVHMADLEGLRSGSLRHLSLEKMEGIITFPSYHAALATVFAWGFFQVPKLGWAGVAIAILTLLATPIDGGHYFVDLIAGIAVAAGSIAIARRAVMLNASGLNNIVRKGRRSGYGMAIPPLT